MIRYPVYYNGIYKNSLWIKFISLQSLREGLKVNFVSSSSGDDLKKIYRSMCNAFYIIAINAFSI